MLFNSYKRAFIPISILVLAIFLYTAFTANAQNKTKHAASKKISFESFFSLPECSNKEHRTTWCTQKNITENFRKQNILPKLLPDSTDNISNIFIASYTFGSKALSDFLCKESAKNKTPITLILDKVKKAENTSRILDCKTNTNYIKNLEIGHGGKWPNWFSQHVKLWIFEFKNSDKLHIVIGNGNATSTSYSLVFNSWIKVIAYKSSNFAKQQQCLATALTEAANNHLADTSGKISKSVYKQSMQKCEKDNKILPFDQALKYEGISALFPIVEGDRPENELIKAISNVKPGESILISGQMFTNLRIAKSLFDAIEKGVQVKLILDDDNLSGVFRTTAGMNFYKRYLKNSKIEIKFIETNHKIYQIMHNKFMLLGKDLLYTGSGQFSHAAFHNNFENLYFINNSAIIAKYKDYYIKLWNLGFSIEK